MKSILLALFCLLISFNLFAADLEEITQTFHERMIERTPDYFKDSQVRLMEEIPKDIEELAAAHYLTLINFAISLNLFSKGFGYKLNDDFYEVINSEGTVIAHTFSVTITKHGVVSSIGMYEAMRRVDGAFYVSRDPAWY